MDKTRQCLVDRLFNICFIGKLFAYKHKYTIDGMQEAFAHAVANIAGSFLGCIPAAASLSRSALQEDCGGQTQVVSFISGVITLICIMVIGPYFSVLPRALLAAVIAVNLRGMFMQFHELRLGWKEVLRTAQKGSFCRARKNFRRFFRLNNPVSGFLVHSVPNLKTLVELFEN